MSAETTGKGQDKVSFGNAVVQRLKDKLWPGDIKFSIDNFSITLGDTGEVLYLDNSYSDWVSQSDEAGRNAVIDRLVQVAFASKAAEKTKHFADAAPNILPAIRSRQYIENVWMYDGAGPADGFSVASRPLCDWLTVIITINAETSIATISDKQLTEWGKSFDEVMTVAMANLERQKTQAFELQDGGFYLLATGDFYDPSVLLLPAKISALPVKGSPVAIAVTRSCVVVAGSDDVPALQQMATFAEAAYTNDPRAISCLPLSLKDGKWVQYIPDRSTYPMIHRLRSLTFLRDYRAQLDILNDYNKKIDRGVYVGQLDAVQDGDRLVTWSSLVSGIITLLPISDVVIVAPADLKNPFARRFTDLMTVAGTVPQEPNTWPPLYIFKDGLDHRLADFLHDRYPQPTEFPDVGKTS